VVGGYRDVGGAVAQHANERGNDTAHGCNFVPCAVTHFGQSIVVTKQLVSAVNEMYFHKAKDRCYLIVRTRVDGACGQPTNVESGGCSSFESGFDFDPRVIPWALHLTIYVCRKTNAELSHPAERPTGAGLREMPEETETEQEEGWGRKAKQSFEEACTAR
jgi:hypothetical protein